MDINSLVVEDATHASKNSAPIPGSDLSCYEPARAKMLKPDQPLRSYQWSSWPEYLKVPGRRLAWLRVERLWGEYHLPQDSTAGRKPLERALEARRAAEDGAAYKPVRRGWFFGGQALKEELLAQVSVQAGGWHYEEEAAHLLFWQCRKARYY